MHFDFDKHFLGNELQKRTYRNWLDRRRQFWQEIKPLQFTPVESKRVYKVTRINETAEIKYIREEIRCFKKALKILLRNMQYPKNIPYRDFKDMKEIYPILKGIIQIENRELKKLLKAPP